MFEGEGHSAGVLGKAFLDGVKAILHENLMVVGSAAFRLPEDTLTEVPILIRIPSVISASRDGIHSPELGGRLRFAGD
ncbi:MAG: hypothetical protein ACK2UO_16530 [Caldilineaceae bacterium]